MTRSIMVIMNNYLIGSILRLLMAQCLQYKHILYSDNGMNINKYTHIPLVRTALPKCSVMRLQNYHHSSIIMCTILAL